MTSDIPTAVEPAPNREAAGAEPARRPWRGRFSFEALLIVLSVLLGFGVSEWRQAGADRELANTVLQNVREELEHNMAELDRILPRHQQILDLVIAADTSDPTRSGWDVIFGALRQAGSGLTPPALRQGAWDAAVSTGALRLLDYELVAALSEIYHRQATSADFFSRAMTAYDPALFEPGRQSETVQAFRWTIVELVNFENDLQTLYTQRLPSLTAAAER